MPFRSSKESKMSFVFTSQWVLAIGLAFLSSFHVAEAATIPGSMYIDGNKVVGVTDENFICATLDWWPAEKCNYGQCPWHNASLITMDLDNNILSNAVKAFSPLKIRLGGTLQDKLTYDTPDNTLPCPQFSKNDSELFGFTPGCFSMKRWDELNTFFKKTRSVVVFGLNALAGRTIRPDGLAVGAWDRSNAASFINYTISKKYDIYGWELGNELCGSGVGTRVEASQYASDTASLYNVVQKLYAGEKVKPKVISPGGFFEKKWFAEFLKKGGRSVDAVTHHMYNLGPGNADNLIDNILSPEYLEGEEGTFRDLRDIIRSSPTAADAWVGESGGAYNSGGNHVSNSFVDSFWYLHQLGMASAYDTKTYCRQALIGGNYGLLNTSTFEPNPDYYSALLWHRLMGTRVLSTNFSGSKNVRVFAHCGKLKGVTLLLMNFERETTVEVGVGFNSSWHKFHHHHSSHGFGFGKGRMHRRMVRSEYHLTPKDGDLHSQVMLLNGGALAVDAAGNLPPLLPIHVEISQPIRLAPLSIAFVRVPHLLPACITNRH